MAFKNACNPLLFRSALRHWAWGSANLILLCQPPAWDRRDLLLPVCFLFLWAPRQQNVFPRAAMLAPEPVPVHSGSDTPRTGFSVLLWSDQQQPAAGKSPEGRSQLCPFPLSFSALIIPASFLPLRAWMWQLMAPCESVPQWCSEFSFILPFIVCDMMPAIFNIVFSVLK